MNNQEFFDKTMEHLRKQVVQSRGEASCCLYRGPNGTSCAIGCHIPDELYEPEMESRGVGNLTTYFPEVGALFNGVNSCLLLEMQTLHDVWLDRSVEHMEGRAKEIASAYALTYKDYYE